LLGCWFILHTECKLQQQKIITNEHSMEFLDFSLSPFCINPTPNSVKIRTVVYKCNWHARLLDEFWVWGIINLCVVKLPCIIYIRLIDCKSKVIFIYWENTFKNGIKEFSTNSVIFNFKIRTKVSNLSSVWNVSIVFPSSDITFVNGLMKCYGTARCFF